MTDTAAARVVRAVTNPGPNPAYHFQVMDRHRVEWPTLWAAIDALIAEQEGAT